MARPFHLVVNRRAGPGKAAEFVNSEVIPALDKLGIKYEYYETQSEGDAGRIGTTILSATPPGETITVVIAGGDGTAHELIEGVLASTHGKADAPIGRWEFVILPLGTANALHSTLFPEQDKTVEGLKSLEETIKLPKDKAKLHQLASLYLALSKTAQPSLLPITLTSILDESGQPVSLNSPATKGITSETTSDETCAPPTPSHIVLSTSLHAALLSDSDELRDEYPGLERFKVAAAKNIPVAFKADATLTGSVKQYDPRSDSFVEPFSAPVDKEGKVLLNGPFSYLLSTTTAPRLEPTFVIAPTLTTHPSDKKTLKQTTDIIIIRPNRSQAVIQAEGEEAQAAARAAIATQVLGRAYQNGAHVSLVYAKDGSVVPVNSVKASTDKPKDDVVVEVYRAEGFEWVPTDASHDRSHILCADGSIYTIPKGGRASVNVLPIQESANDQGFFVWG